MAKERSSAPARLLPRSLLGLVALILAAALGAAFSGTVLFAYYSYQLNKTNQRIDSYVNGFDNRFKTADQTINNDVTNGRAQISKALAPLLKLSSTGSQLESQLSKASPSVYFVHTLDDNGAPSVGSAFVVASDNTQSLLVTSYTTVTAATHTPAPPVFVRKNNQDTRAQVFNWDQGNDLALLIVNTPNLPKLNFAPTSPGLNVGDTVFALSGLGSSGGSISEGSVDDRSSNLIQDDAPVGSAGQGGPLLNSAGQVVGVASLTYAPLGFSSNGVYFSVPISNACSHILRCPGGNIGGVGNQGSG
jgi:S1-C subfamily serine protease